MSRNKQSDPRELEERIERIRLQNEKINKRYLEVEADKKKAKDLNAMVQVTVVPEDWTCHRNMLDVHNRMDNSDQHSKHEPEWDDRQTDGQGNQTRRAGRGNRGSTARRQTRGRYPRQFNEERDEHWRREREQIDQDRISRQKTSNGDWKREWDSEKISENSRSGQPSSQAPFQGPTSPQFSRYSGRSPHHHSFGQIRARHIRSPTREDTPPQPQGRAIVKTGAYETTVPSLPADRPSHGQHARRVEQLEHEQVHESSPRKLTLLPGDAGREGEMPRIAITITNNRQEPAQTVEARDVASATPVTETCSLVSNVQLQALSPKHGEMIQLDGDAPQADESGLESDSDESWEDVASSAENLASNVENILITVDLSTDKSDVSFGALETGRRAAEPLQNEGVADPRQDKEVAETEQVEEAAETKQVEVAAKTGQNEGVALLRQHEGVTMLRQDEGQAETRQDEENGIGSEPQSDLSKSLDEGETVTEANEVGLFDTSYESEEFHLAESDSDQLEVDSLSPEPNEEVLSDNGEECVTQETSVVVEVEDAKIKTESTSAVGHSEENAAVILKSVTDQYREMSVNELAGAPVEKEDVTLVTLATNVDQGSVLVSEDGSNKLPGEQQ